jgi:hypothetical protein
VEHIAVAGHPDPVPASSSAARLLHERLDTVREQRGEEASQALETLVGRRIGTLLEDSVPSIDVATMRAIVDYVELPEEEDTATGMGRALRGLKDRFAQRGGPAR